MNKKYLFPIASALFSAMMLMLSEILGVKYGYSMIVRLFFLNLFGGLIVFVILKDKFNNTKKIITGNPYLLIGASVFSYLLAGIAAFYATTHIGSTKTSFALQLETLFIVIFSIVFLKEKITKKVAFAGILIICGGFLLQINETGFIFVWADLIALLAPLLMSVGIMLNSILLKKYDAVTVTAIGMLLSTFLLIFTIPWMHDTFTWPALLLLSSMGILEGLAWLCYNKGIAAVGTSVTTILFGTIPFFTLLCSWTLNHFFEGLYIMPENLGYVMSGGVLIFIGLGIISLKEN